MRDKQKEKEGGDESVSNPMLAGRQNGRGLEYGL